MLTGVQSCLCSVKHACAPPVTCIIVYSVYYVVYILFIYVYIADTNRDVLKLYNNNNRSTQIFDLRTNRLLLKTWRPCESVKIILSFAIPFRVVYTRRHHHNLYIIIICYDRSPWLNIICIYLLLLLCEF